MKLLSTLLISLVILSSCGDNTDSITENAGGSGNYTFQIVDSLVVDYLGAGLLADVSSDGNRFLIYDGQRTAFLVTDKEGTILYQFEKSGDIPDSPGSLFNPPAFHGTDQIALYATRGYFIFDFSGNLIKKVEDVTSRSMVISRNYPKAVYPITFQNQPAILSPNMDVLVRNPAKDDYYVENRAVQIVLTETDSILPMIPLEANSRYLDGKGYTAMKILPKISLNNNKLSVTYPKESRVYLYDYTSNGFELDQVLEMEPSVFYIDNGADRESLDNSSGNSGFSFGSKMGEASVNASYHFGNTVIVEYNPGLPEDLREEAKLITTSEGSMTLVNPDNIPSNLWQVFVDGRKQTDGFLAPDVLGNFALGHGEDLWFSRGPSEEEELDYLIFYKVKLIEE
jgi:hypothetical protein